MNEHWAKGKSVHNPGRNAKVHGEIPGYPVGSTFDDRVECSQAGVHAPLRAGIHGNAEDGAFSVVLSHGYEDDEDLGETFEYSGQGGRDTKGDLIDIVQGKVKWDGKQNADQEWVLGNKALKISCATQKPVRVIRGAVRKKGDHSKYAPLEGYRYDGLYVVDKAWKAVGKTGFQTCRFAFQRLPNQPPIRVFAGVSAPPAPVAGPSRTMKLEAPPSRDTPRPMAPMPRPSNAVASSSRIPPRPAGRPQPSGVTPLTMVQVGIPSRLLPRESRKRPREESECWSESSDDRQRPQARGGDRWATVRGNRDTVLGKLKFKKKPPTDIV